MNYFVEGFTATGQVLLWVVGGLLAIGLVGFLAIVLLYLVALVILRSRKDDYEEYDE